MAEAGGHVDVTVSRTGDTSGTATVDYTTFDETPGSGTRDAGIRLRDRSWYADLCAGRGLEDIPGPDR